MSVPNQKLAALRGIAALALFGVPAFPQAVDPPCDGNSTRLVAGVHIHASRVDCVRATGGFAAEAGSFAKLSLAGTNHLGLGETVELSAQYGTRLRKAQIGLTKPLSGDKRIQAAISFYGQRYWYDQARDASILAFNRNVTEAQDIAPDNLLKYALRSYGATASLSVAPRNEFSRFEVAYSYGVTDAGLRTPATAAYFGTFDFLGAPAENKLGGIRTSKATVTYTRNTVDDAATPSRGAEITASAALAGLGGDVREIEPKFDVKWYHPGFHRGHVIAAHFNGRMLLGYGGRSAAPFDRFYQGGEDQIRGFPSGSLSPVAYIPDTVLIPVLNADGTVRTYGGVPLMATLLMYRPVAIGGDTALIGNFEYRIALFRPLTLALFTDAGLNRASFATQARINRGAANNLSAEFGGAAVATRLIVSQASQKIRMSSGVELQARVPRLGAPVRLYWAYNELRCGNPGVTLADMPACSLMIPPFVTIGFANYPTYVNAQSALRPNLTHDPRSMLRASIGWTF